MCRIHRNGLVRGLGLGLWLLLGTAPAALGLNLGPEELVQAAGEPMQVTGYSVPSFVDWNQDGLADLIVGEGGGGYPGRVRVYPGLGTVQAPVFDGFFFVQAAGEDLILPDSGCMGLFPRVVYWDADGRKDLLVGTATGNIRIYLNLGTDHEPVFDAGTDLQFSPHGSRVVIDVGNRATPEFTDWDNDGRRDLVVGAYDGKIHILLNSGTDTEPAFESVVFAQENGTDLVVPGSRSSPVVGDFDDDQKKDILTGNTYGQLLLYRNVGTDAAPTFSGHDPVEAGTDPIDLPDSPRSRPCLCDWSGDGFPDVLIGAGDGRVHLFQGLPTIDVPLVDSSPAARLLAPWPNPFNPRVTISVQVAESTPVRLTLHDPAGRLVARLADQILPPGRQDLLWDGTDNRGRTLPSGTYLARLQTTTGAEYRKLILLR